MRNNFKKELIDDLKSEGLTLEDIRWVGTRDIKYNLNIFLNSLDSGCGGTVINTGLLIVGDNWWLERHEYDGSEWWEFKKYPEEPKYTADKFKIISVWWKD